MKQQETAGVWPVMLTPFTPAGEIDYNALDELIDWYTASGVTGLFAVCQSSEMFYLSRKERLELAGYIKRRAAIPVIASGHISDAPSQQIDELTAMAGTGVDGVVLITNRAAQEGRPSQAWIDGMTALLAKLPQGVPLGLYECPYPYKRVLTEQELAFCAGSGRFRFLKDTCCDLQRIARRLELLEGGELKLFNANTATLLDSLQLGAEGFSGVMANFHPDLYVWLCRNWKTHPEQAKRLQAGLTFASMIEKQYYPNNAKIFLGSIGLRIGEYCRVRSGNCIAALDRDEIRQLTVLTGMLRELIQ